MSNPYGCPLDPDIVSSIPRGAYRRAYRRRLRECERSARPARPWVRGFRVGSEFYIADILAAGFTVAKLTALATAANRRATATRSAVRLVSADIPPAERRAARVAIRIAARGSAVRARLSARSARR